MEAKPLVWSTSASSNWLRQFWPVLIGLAVLAVPTVAALASDYWSKEAGAHGPLVLATGLWLIWRERSARSSIVPHSSWSTTLSILLPSLLLFVFGRAFDYLSLQTLGLYGACVAVLYEMWGPRALRPLWFPLFYLAFIIPVPGWALDYATAPLKQLASVATTNLLQLFGVPIAREGVILFVAQYQLLVEDACAGLNALMGLISMGLFYAYLMHGSSWRYALALSAFIIPIAVIANVIRIIILVLLTLWAGNDAAQSYLHGMAGLVMFASALGLVFVVDSILSRSFRPKLT